MQAKGLGEPNRNFWLGVYNGIFINGAEAFFHSSLVLAPFLAALGAPAALIGLIPALRVGGWFLPQLFVASLLAHEPFKLPWYRRVSLLRNMTYFVMVGAVFYLENPTLIMWVVLTMIAINAVASGVSGVPFADVTAKVVPHSRLGTFWVLRNAIGGMLALVSGVVLRQVLASDIPFPHNFGYLFLIGTILTGVSYTCFSLIKEPAGKASVKQPFLTMVGRIPEVLRQDVAFRRYLRVRFLALLAMLAEPFYAVYALRELGAPASALGFFVILATFSSIAANFALRKAANEGRNVTVFQISVTLLLLAPLVALLMPSWQLFSAVFMLSAAGNSGMGIAAWNLLYAVSPEGDRPLYVGTANSFLSLPSFAPILAGGLSDFVGFRFIFALAGAIAITALGFAFRFKELRSLDEAALRRAGA